MERLQRDFDTFYEDKAAFKPAVIFVGAALGGRWILNLRGADAMQYGAMVSVGASIMDGILIAVGADKKIGKAFGDAGSGYVDPVDFVGGGLAGLGLFYLAGDRGSNLLTAAVLGGAVSGVAPLLADKLVSMFVKNKLQQQVPSRAAVVLRD